MRGPGGIGAYGSSFFVSFKGEPFVLTSAHNCTESSQVWFNFGGNSAELNGILSHSDFRMRPVAIDGDTTWEVLTPEFDMSMISLSKDIQSQMNGNITPFSLATDHLNGKGHYSSYKVIGFGKPDGFPLEFPYYGGIREIPSELIDLHEDVIDVRVENNQRFIYGGSSGGVMIGEKDDGSFEAIGILSSHYSRQGLHRFTRISTQRLEEQIEAGKMVPRDVGL